MSLISGSRTKEVKYIYDLPYTERKLLCDILDINSQWERLGGTYMNFKVLDLEKMKQAEKCGESPTERLLQRWGHMNNTVLKLYQLLHQMQHYQAMNVLFPFVPTKYRILPSKTLFTEIDSFKNDPIPPDTMLHNFQNQPSTRNPISTYDGETGAVGFTCKKSQYFDMKHPENYTSDMNSGHCMMDAAAHVQTVCKVPDSLLRLGDQSVALAEAIEPKKEDRAALHNKPQKVGKLLNTLLSPAKESHSCEENVTRSLPEELNEKLDLDNVKVNANYNYATKLRETREEANCKDCSERISQKATMQLQQNYDQVGAEMTPTPNSTHGSIALSKKRCTFSCSESTQSVLPAISYEELEKASDYWRDDHLLGKGGFGFVYKGIWKNTKVAIKKITQNPESIGAIPPPLSQRLEELLILQKYRHDNILQVYGFSDEADKPSCIVYQLMPFGSLEDRLQCRKIRGFYEEDLNSGLSEPLNWRVRFNIAYGTAAAIQFLHTVQEKPLIHGDIKSANILLDRNYEPKLGDFGLAREGPLSPDTSLKVSRVHGTRPYIPDEYLRSKRLSTKVDTYSFGIVMFELCTGCKAYDEKKTSGKFLKDVVQDTEDKRLLIDKKAGLKDSEVFDNLLELGLHCINSSPKQRPEMKDAYERLEAYNKVLKEQDLARSKRIEQCSTYVSPSHLQGIQRSISTSPSNPSFMLVHPHSSLVSHHPPPSVPPQFHAHRNVYPPRTPYISYMSPAASYMTFGNHMRRENVSSLRASLSNHLVAKQLEPVRQNDCTSEGAQLLINSVDQPAIVEESSTNQYKTDAAQVSNKNDCAYYSSNNSNLPLITELGVKPANSYEKSGKVVSSQGKATFLDSNHSDEDDEDDDDNSSSD